MTRTFPEPDPAVALLEQRRQELGLTYSELANRSGLAYNTWRACVDGRRGPSIATLRTMAETLGYTIELRPIDTAQATREAAERKP